MKVLDQAARKEVPLPGATSNEVAMLVLAPYSTLINEKILVPSSATPYFAVEQHFFFAFMKEFLKKIYLDEQWYLSRYPDVKEAIGKGLVANAKEHYSRFGYYEHRMPHPIAVDNDWYLETYSDVNESLKKRHFTSATNHFEVVGFKEGRLPFAGFKLRVVDAE